MVKVRGLRFCIDESFHAMRKFCVCCRTQRWVFLGFEQNWCGSLKPCDSCVSVSMFTVWLSVWSYLCINMNPPPLQCWCARRVSRWTAGAWRRWWRGTPRTSSSSYSRSSGRPKRWEGKGQSLWSTRMHCALYSLCINVFLSVCVCLGSGAVSVWAGGSPRHHVLLHTASGTNHPDVIKTFNSLTPLFISQGVSLVSSPVHPKVIQFLKSNHYNLLMLDRHLAKKECL